MKDGSVCSESSNSSEAETAASAPTPATYAEAAAASPTQPPALAMASPIHSPTHSNIYTPPASLCQAQIILIANITTKHTRAEIEIKLRRQFPGRRYALTSPTMVTSSQSSPHSHQSPRHHSHHNTPPPPPRRHRQPSSQPSTRTSLRLRERNRAQSQS